jgi:uncharacterized protein YgbK (DUF1537 family)
MITWADAVRDVLPSLAIPDAAGQVRRGRAAVGSRVAVIDDDPTGSQSVHDVEVVTDPTRLDDLDEALAAPGAVCFVLTNSRSMPVADAVAVNSHLGTHLAEVERDTGQRTTVLSRGDSTLRGHVLAETGALDEARRRVLGRGYDAVLLCPAFPDAGRVTVGDIHWARIDGRFVDVASTEFAHDAAFGYSHSRLPDFLAERSGGAIRAEDVRSIALADIRGGGPDRVAELLLDVPAGAFVVVNALDDDDLDVVALGIGAAERAGRVLLARCGPSLVRAVAGVEPAAPLDAGRLWPAGRRPGHGLVVVGSHTAATTAQLDAAAADGQLARLELDVTAVLDPSRRAAHLDAVAAAATTALRHIDVAVATSRTVTADPTEGAPLAVARTVSAALSAVVARLRPARPAWVVAKGGITSHDTAVTGLGIRRARVLGQVLPGLISVFDPLVAPAEVLGMPYVVFAGNVGGPDGLVAVLSLLRSEGP